jgi:SAM-dependent methyltransferase
MQKQNPTRFAGCDQATEMVRLASENVPEAEIIQIDGEHLPFKDDEFDVVTTVTVLQHNPDNRRSEIMSEICRVAREELYLFEDTSLAMPPAATGGGGDYQNFYGRPVTWYQKECEDHGFSLVETKYQETYISHRTFMYLCRLLDRRKQREGSPISKLHLAIERGTLPITKHLDRRIKNRKGELTMMRFTPTARG